MAPAGSLHPDNHNNLDPRPGWIDAVIAIEQLDEGRASSGDRGVLWLRGRIQRQLRSFGHFLDLHAGKVLFVAILIIATFCVGLKSSTFHSNVEQLWASEVLAPSANTNLDTATSSNSVSSGSDLNNDSPPASEMLSTHQMVIQTGVDREANLLNAQSLLEHLTVIRRATQVTITMYDITWRLKDICQSPSVPNFDVHYIEQMFENMMPCSIITPLDCFWEGSKLLGPDYPVHIPYGIGNHVKWTNLNPSQLVSQLKKKESGFDYHSLEDYFKRAGITSGYQEKPCLNPRDPECPISSKNRNSSQPLDIGSELTSGCYGFAAKYMHWPADLIVGGSLKNKTGHMKKAKALQTVIQLMSEQELFDFYSGTYKIHHIGWNQEKAALILSAWQKRFAHEIQLLVKDNISSMYTFDTFSTSNLNKVLAEQSQTDYVRLGIVLVVVCFYAWFTQSGLAAIGVVLLASSTAAGLGVCSLLGLPMNLLSTHVLPFISVGLAMRDLFLILSLHNEVISPAEIMVRIGPIIMSATVMYVAVFLVAAIVPVVALRIYCLQSAVLAVFHSVAILLVFPTLIALEIRFKKAAVPCFRDDSTKLGKNDSSIGSNNNNNTINGAEQQSMLTAELICHQKRKLLYSFISHYTSFVIFKPVIRVFICMLYAGVTVFCIFNGLKVEYDIRLSSFLPKATQEYRYLEYQNRYFGFYNFYLVTKEMEYPHSQSMLHEYHSSLTQVPHVLKDSNGGLNNNDFWLANFREFLVDLQTEFDENRSKGCMNDEKWFPNATEKAVLAFKLLAQTGIVEFPVDKSQIFKKKLVNDGIVDSKAFYNYLSAWNSNDDMSYSSSQANLMPKPFQYYSTKSEFELKIPKSQPLVYAQMPFYLKNLRTTSSIIKTLKQIFGICESYGVRGIKTYPVGLIFAYFGQFLYLDRVLIVQLLLTLLTSFAISCLLVQWTKLWCAFFSSLVTMLVFCFLNVNALTGTMGALHFLIVHRDVLLLLTGYQSVLGTRERRLRMTLEQHLECIMKGHGALLICVGVLLMSHFEFVQIYISRTVLLSIGAALVNSFVFFPITLAIVGPRGELQCDEREHYRTVLAAPLTDAQPKVDGQDPINSNTTATSNPGTPVGNSASGSTAKTPRRMTASSNKATREPSLTTITEESGCNQSIVVEPQVTVEYSSPESSSSGGVAKVTATANIKVELVAPLYTTTRHASKCAGKHSRVNKCARRVPTQTSHCKCACAKADTDSESSDEVDKEEKDCIKS